jgi:CO/xanthine dehydrogenase Mo-binding subunit
MILDQTIVVTDKVRYVGDPVAAVAAIDIFAAEEALCSIKVDYEELEGVFSVDEALAPDATLIHNNIPVPPALQAVLNPSQDQYLQSLQTEAWGCRRVPGTDLF